MSDRYTFRELGFHADPNLLAVAGYCLSRSKQFVETGTNVASTLCHVARHYPQIVSFSCEPSPKAYTLAWTNLDRVLGPERRDRVKLSHMKSPLFLEEMFGSYPARRNRPTTFWLDAHGQGFDWPLPQEVSFIDWGWEAPAYILIDDCQVPNEEGWLYEVHEGLPIAYASVSHFLSRPHRLYYPNYAPATSPAYGWCLITLNADPLPLHLPIVQAEVTLGAVA